jgi:hypothetical protein
MEFLPFKNLAGRSNDVDDLPHVFINFHEAPLSILKLDASSREAGQGSGGSLAASFAPNP